jgi:hypothetical protein
VFVVVRVAHRVHGDAFSAHPFEHPLEESDLTLLDLDDLLREVDQFLPVGTPLHELRHLNDALVVRDHPLHETRHQPR